jgi:hypothetical protein
VSDLGDIIRQRFTHAEVLEAATLRVSAAEREVEQAKAAVGATSSLKAISAALAVARQHLAVAEQERDELMLESDLTVRPVPPPAPPSAWSKLKAFFATE